MPAFVDLVTGSRYCCFDHGMPSVDLVLHVFRSLLDRGPESLGRQLLEQILQRGLAQSLVHVCIDLVDNVPRSLWRRDDAEPCDRFKARQRLSDGWHVREGWKPTSRSHCQQFELSGSNQRQRDSEVVEHQIDITGQQPLQRRSRPAIGWRSFTFAINWKSSDVRCEIVPFSCVAEVSLSGLFFRYSINSPKFDDFTLVDDQRVGTIAITMTGSNLSGSKAVAIEFD